MTFLEYIKARIVEEGECWIWTRAVRNQPEMNSSHGRGSVRRYLWKEMTGVAARKDSYITTKCGDKRCVNPAHIQQKKISVVRTAVPISATHRQKLALIAQSRSKLNMEKVRAIRADRRTHEEIAKDYGVTECNVSKIKRNKSWIDTANPWQGLFR